MREANHIKPDQHVFICGRTGSGKSYLAKVYLAAYPRVVALDTKGDMQWDTVNDCIIVETLTDLADYIKTENFHIIYRPRFEELNEDSYNEFFRMLYFRKDCIVWVDEAMSICRNSMVIPEYYRAILTRGRSRKTAVWSLTQRPSNLPQIIISESSHFFVFDLNLPQDREKLVNVTGAQEFYTKPSRGIGDKAKFSKFAFWYYFIDWEHAERGELKVRG